MKRWVLLFGMVAVAYALMLSDLQAAGPGGTVQKDRVQLQKRDGSCLTTATAATATTPLQTRDQQRKRDGSCLATTTDTSATGWVAPTTSTTPLRTRSQLRSCK